MTCVLKAEKFGGDFPFGLEQPGKRKGGLCIRDGHQRGRSPWNAGPSSPRRSFLACLPLALVQALVLGGLQGFASAQEAWESGADLPGWEGLAKEGCRGPGAMGMDHWPMRQ